MPASIATPTRSKTATERIGPRTLVDAPVATELGSSVPPHARPPSAGRPSITRVSALGSTARLIAAALALLVAGALVVALWRIGDGIRQQGCVAKVQARYPAVPVSAYATRGTGPLKLSYAGERARAVAVC